MAVYFLDRSPTYRRQTSTEIYRRREVVCKHLKDDYKVRKFTDQKTYEHIASELAAENIEITESEYRADKVLIRTAYVWLMAGTEEDKAKITNTNAPTTKAGINCLIKDGIMTWADLKLDDTIPAGTQDPIARESTFVPPSARLKLSECQAGADVVEIFSQLVDKLEGMLTENQQLKGEITRLTEENEPLKARATDDERYIELVESELTAAEQKGRELRETIRSNQASAHAATLETIALENPDFPQLLVIAQQLKAQRKQQGKVLELFGKLPTAFNWQNDAGKIEYRDQFLQALESFTGDEQGRVVKQLEILSIQGPEYTSLHTRKIDMRLPYSPPFCLVSRGADNLRFTWKKNGDIVIYWLYRKGDTRVRQTEQ